MAVASLPPVIEIREFSTSHTTSMATDAFWAKTLPESSESSWKVIAFGRIASLEQGVNIAGAGDFRASESAAGQLRLYLSKIALQSLPIPTIVPLSGRGIMLSWESGTRAIEVTAFADGEIVLTAIENHEANEELVEETSESLLKWLVKAPETQPSNAATR